VIHADGSCERLATLNLPLGVDDEATWEEAEVVLAPGDTLVSMSDGIIDLFDGTLDGLEKARAIVHEAKTARDAVEAIEALAGEVGIPDDITVLVVRHKAA
jgi:serine phosphatase RsbU (regulator of sigma subunit)